MILVIVFFHVNTSACKLIISDFCALKFKVNWLRVC